MEMRGFCVQYSERKIRERRNIEKDLSDQIDALMKVLATSRSKENITKLYRLRSELNKIIEYRTKGAIIRSRTRRGDSRKYPYLYHGWLLGFPKGRGVL